MKNKKNSKKKNNINKVIDIINKNKIILIIALILIIIIAIYLAIKYPFNNENTTGGGDNPPSSSSLIPEESTNSKNSGKSSKKPSSSSSSPKVVKDKVISKKVKIKDSRLVVDKITYSYADTRYSLYFTINNDTNMSLDLKNYNAYLKDSKGNIISILDGSIFGTIKAKDKSNAMVYYTDDISSVKTIEFIEK